MHELTKSQFMDYLVCPAYCWMKVNQQTKFLDVCKNLGIGSEDFAEQVRRFGREIDGKAQLLFEQGVKIETEESHQAIQETEEAIQSGAEVVYQAGFGNNSFLIRADIIRRHPDNSDQWTLYEVKSSTRAKKEHYIDLAFQKVVCQAIGYRIADVRLILLDKNYRLGQDGAQDSIEDLFVKDEVDGQLGLSVDHLVEELIDGDSKHLEGSVESRMNQAKSALDSPDKQECNCRFKPKSKHCPTFFHFNPNVPAYSIYNLSRVTQKKVEQLVEADLIDIKDLAEADIDPYKFSPVQKKQLELYPDRVEVNKAAIESEFSQLKFPLYFLDYETVSTPIPVFKNSGPYWHLPFLYSIHIDSKQVLEGDLEHFDYLLEDRNLKRLENLVSKLVESLGESGSVIVWHKGFESAVNNKLAEIFPGKRQDLEKINQRMYDLETIFTKRYYQSGQFKGKTSIKQIATSLCPDYDYQSDQDLIIKDGGQATHDWQVAVDSHTPLKTQKEIFRDLRQYCARDTWVMVEVYRYLKKALIEG